MLKLSDLAVLSTFTALIGPFPPSVFLRPLLRECVLRPEQGRVLSERGETRRLWLLVFTPYRPGVYIYAHEAPWVKGVLGGVASRVQAARLTTGG